MDNNSDEQFIIVQVTTEANKQDSDEKITKLIEDFKAMIASSIASITDKINTLKSFPTHNDSPKPPDTTTVVPANRRDPPLDGGQKKLVPFGL